MTRMDLVIFLYSNSNHLISLIPPKLPQILDIYLVVVLWGTALYEKQDAQLGIESVGHIGKDSNGNRSR